MRDEPADAPVVRRNKGSAASRRRRRTARRFGVGTLAVIAVLAVAAAGLALWTYRNVKRVDLDLAEVSHTEPRNYLVIGSDSRETVAEDDPHADAMLGKDAPGGQRSDSIAILRIDPAGERVDVLSIPRDLWVTQPSGEESKINAAYAESTQTLIDTIDDNLGIPIHHYVEVDFTGFQQLIDALGGVPMYFDSPVRDPNTGLNVRAAGCTVLDGPQGLAFARSRSLQWKDAEGWHTDGSGDLGRMTRQQLLMRAAVARAGDLDLDDLGRLKGLVDAGLAATTIDSGLGFGDVFGLGKHFRGFDPQRLQTHSLAIEEARSDGGASIVLLDEAGSAETLAFFRGSSAPTAVTTTTVPPPSEGDVTVDVYNAGAADGEGRRVSYVLTDGGFVIGDVDTAPKERAVTVVRHAPGGAAMAELVAGWLGPRPEVEESDDVAPGSVVVLLGADFESVSEPAKKPAGGSGGEPVEEPGDTSDGSGAGSSSTTTTSTVPPGWTPGVAPAGISCS